MTFPGNDDRIFLLDEQSMINTPWILSRKSSVPQAIPSWTGFNIKIRDNITPSKCSVGYLECLDFPASDTSTIFEILNRCLDYCLRLRPSGICKGNGNQVENARSVQRLYFDAGHVAYDDDVLWHYRTMFQRYRIA